MEFIIHCKCLLYVHYTVYPIYMNTMEKFLYCRFDNYLKGVFAKNERGYRLNAIKKRF